MSNPNHHEGECCACGRVAPIDATEMCVSCTEEMNAVIDEREEREGPVMRLASGNANPDEEPEFLDTPDNDSFADACGQMTREDWDADNDWLASAGWGEM